jgi:hypothetical protein
MYIIIYTHTGMRHAPLKRSDASGYTHTQHLPNYRATHMGMLLSANFGTTVNARLILDIFCFPPRAEEKGIM